MLMGFIPTVGHLAGARVSTLTRVADGGSASSTTSLPSGSQAGDVCILFDFANNSSGTPTTVVPSGFTTISNLDGGSTSRRILSAGILTAADITAGTLTGMSGTNYVHKLVVGFRPDVAITSGSVGSANEEITNGNPTLQTITASGGAAPLVVFAMGCQNSGITMSGTLTSTGTQVTNLNSRLRAYYHIYNTSPADLTVDMGDFGNNNSLHSAYFQVS